VSLEYVPIFHPSKAAALVMLGHPDLDMVVRGDKEVIVFEATPKFKADYAKLERISRTITDLYNGNAPYRPNVIKEAAAPDGE
jgi:hypothetical protein